MNKIIFIGIVIITDILFSNFFFKKTSYWNNINWEDKYWRVPSKIYHHKILPNIDVIEKWDGKKQKRIFTNSIGFFDKKIRKVKKINNKKRILLIGDSFIEGSGIDYEKTFSGLLDKHLGEEYEILNSALASYSPSIYFKKTEYFLNEGYKFDQVLVFLDVSDIFDELFIKFDSNGKILTYDEAKKVNIFKKKFYKTGGWLRDNSVIFRTLYLISDKTELLKNYLKLKYKVAKKLNKNFLEVSKDEVTFYRMTNIDRGFWTFNDKTYEVVKKGLIQSEKYLVKLFNLLKDNNISSTLIVYPWPTQILYGDNMHLPHWRKFSKKNNINFLSLYNDFKGIDKKKIIFENFIYGDIHWNESGSKIIFDRIVETIKF